MVSSDSVNLSLIPHFFVPLPPFFLVEKSIIVEILKNEYIIGMAVCYHRDEVGKLLVAEKNGLIHLYNILSHQAILSLDSGCVPLMSADWSPSNCLLVAAVAGGELLVWDMSRPR